MGNTVKQVFRDYESNSIELSEAIIEKIELFKKVKKLCIELKAKKHIQIRDIFNLSKFIEGRFRN